MACLLLWHHKQRQAKLCTMSMLIQNQDTSRYHRRKSAKKVILEPRLFRGVAPGATRLGHAEVACGGEEALPVLLGDPYGHTAALAETTIGAQCSGPGRPAVLSEAQVTLLSGEVAKVTARVPLCSSVICDVMAVELDKIGVDWRPSTR